MVSWQPTVGGVSKHEHDRCLSAVEEAQAHLGEPAFATAWAMGQAMTLDQAVAYALREDKADEPPEEPAR